jgi:hypothetical protein
MANPLRGEIEAELDGRTLTLCLTLGALAELESALGGGDILALAERFERGRLGASELAAIIGAGLRGGGNAVADDEVLAMKTPGGAGGYIDIVARLLKATFTPLGEETGGAAT